MRTVYQYIRPYLKMVIFCLVIKTLGGFTELAIPSMLGRIIDEDVPSGEMRRVLISGGIMVGFAFLTFLFNVIGNRISAKASGLIARDLRYALFCKTIYLDTQDTDKLGISSLTSRLTSDTYNITSFISRLQRLGVKAPLMLIGGIAITLTIDARLALVLIAVMPLVCVTVYVITKKSIPIYTEEQILLDGIVKRVDETASGIRVIKALSKGEYEKERFGENSKLLASKEIKAGKLMSLTKPTTDFLLNIGLCGVIFVGAFLAMKYGENSAGKLLTFMTYFTIILNNMIMMTRIFVQMSRSIASAARIEEVLLTDRKLLESQENAKIEEPFIVFDNVSFSYNKRINNLDCASFSVERGQTIGIIGSTGAGKTTVINLLLRLYDVDSGEIRINGRNIKAIPKEELYSMFGVAFQNDFVPAGTVYENISFFRDLSVDLVNDAMTIAQAKDFVSSFDEGTDRHVTTRGTNISGGQRQRLLISRAIANDPEILILDDSSSALDYKTDMNLRKALNSKINTTTFIIAQRISSIKNADIILVIDEGRIIGKGTHDFLMENVEEYRSIAKVQMGQ